MRKMAFAFLASLLLSIAHIPTLSAAETVGLIERLKGPASRTDAAGESVISAGSNILAGDILKTGNGTRMIVRFLDQSTLTLGENAEVLVDEMIYTPAGAEPESGSQSLKFVQGVFRFVSGKVGKAIPRNVALDTPVATIGIRGTEVIFGELTVGMPPGVPHYGFQIYDGAVAITSTQGTVILDEPGEGTFLPIGREAAPTPVRQWTAEEAQEALDALAF